MARALTRPTALDLLAAPARASLSPLDQPTRDAVADFARRIATPAKASTTTTTPTGDTAR